MPISWLKIEVSPANHLFMSPSLTTSVQGSSDRAANSFAKTGGWLLPEADRQHAPVRVV